MIYSFWGRGKPGDEGNQSSLEKTSTVNTKQHKADLGEEFPQESKLQPEDGIKML